MGGLWLGRAADAHDYPPPRACRLTHELLEPEAVALGEDRNGAEVDVELMTSYDLADRGLVSIGRGQQRRELAGDDIP